MKYGLLALALIALLGTAPALSQAPTPSSTWQYRWQKGKTLTYRVEHVTNVAEVVAGNAVATASKLNLTKRWLVTDVDAQGIGTLQLTLAAMRNEQTRPSGDVIVFDSANPAKSSPEVKEMGKYVGSKLAVLKVDKYGQVVEVVEGQKSRYEAEPPFVVVLSAVAPKEGQAWKRSYTITLDPPAGTGEKFSTEQRFDVTKLDDAQVVLKIGTKLQAPPENGRDMLPLLQKIIEGDVTFNFAAGRMENARLVIDRTVRNHQGEGSSYQLKSIYTEQFVE